MERKGDLIRESIIRDMSEGVMTVGLDGVIGAVNGAAERILDRPARELTGKRFASAFFEYEENDAFNQAVLDAIYDAGASHESFVPYFTGSVTRQLHITTSFLQDNGEKVAVIAVLSDISELAELRDAVKAMERIRALNGQLELRNKLLSETFGRYLSDEIVRQLLETPDGLSLGGRKRSLTVLMSDLRGFTALSERMEPQKLIRLLNHYLGEMTEIIEARGGTIIEFIGDGILAIFGAPAESDRHAADAVTAAVEMQRRMAAVNRWNREQGYPDLEMGIGVNTGEAIVGNIGSEKRTKYGVVGSHVNLCGRIESYTVGGEVLISPATRAAISAAEGLELLGERTVFPKGAREPLCLGNVAGIAGLDCRLEAEASVCLARPVPVRFRVIRDKHNSADAYPGRFTAFSRTNAVLETAAELEPLVNLELEAEELTGLYAKVMERTGSGYRLRFTAYPENFQAFLSAQK